MKEVNYLNNKKGFALIYAILLTGSVLIVGVILMNIITKQLIFSSVSRNSETSYYYAANSGRECLNYYAGIHPKDFYKKTSKAVTFYEEANISCFDQDITMIKDQAVGAKQSYKLENSPLDLDGNKIELFVTFNADCIRRQATCTGDSLEDRSIAVMKAIGYSGSLSRQTKRIAIQVKK